MQIINEFNIDNFKVFLLSIIDKDDKKTYNDVIKQVNLFQSISYYRNFLNKKWHKMNINLIDEIKEYLDGFDNLYEVSIDDLNINNSVSRYQISAYAENWDIQSGILKDKTDDENIYLIINFDDEYQYKIDEESVLVQNRRLDNNELKIFIKTKSKTKDPFNSIKINQEVAGVYGQKNIIIFEKIHTNEFRYLGKFFTSDILFDEINNQKLYYYILSRGASNFEEIFSKAINLQEKIFNEYIDSKTEVMRWVKQRIGQSYFKQLLLTSKKECEITGIENKKLLIASHIKPWSTSTPKERLDKDNGLLLSPTFDKLFDRGLISFDDSGKILLSKNMNKKYKNIIFSPIENDFFIEMNSRKKSYMEYHRKYIFFN